MADEPDAPSTADAAAARRPNRLRVSQWFAIATSVLAVVTVFGLVAGIVAVVRLSDARDLVVNHLDPAATEALRLSNALLDEETGVRGFALAGEEDFLAPYRAGRAEERRALSELDGLVRGAGEEQIADDLRLVQRHAEAWRTGYAEPTITRVRARGAETATTRQSERGQRLFNRVRRSLDQLETDIGAARQRGRDDLSDAATFLAASFALIAVLLIAALINVTTMLRRTVTLPVGALARRVRRVAHGEFDRPVRSRGPRDIADLAADIDSMRLRILNDLATVRDANAKLDAQAQELERSNAELEQFAYVASHDLQEPLRKVASFSQLLEQRYKGQLDERADQYIEFAVDGAKRMQQLINDLLAFSRVGRTTGSFEPVDLNAVLRRAVTSLGAALEEAHAEVEADPLPTVEGEASLLALVFQNLIGNAIKFRSTEAPHVRIGVARENGEWLFSCADNGIGIEPEYADRVFVIFQRLHPKDEYAGTGIGLAMSRKVVEYHGGRIWLDTDVQSGTTFRFTLPALQEDR
jgi:signal transduction histidine kinase